ncbi:hypothetical protein SAMN03097714_1049 [Pantoea ananatis]|nr:hypothetical protein SAMN03097714_1049 [Pantoea ananatis]
MAVRGGFTRCARPAGGLTAMQNGGPFCRTPVGASHPPRRRIYKKKPEREFRLFFECGGERGGHSLRSPCGWPAAMQNGGPFCRTPVGASHPPQRRICKKKRPEVSLDSSLNVAVRGGFEPANKPPQYIVINSIFHIPFSHVHFTCTFFSITVYSLPDFNPGRERFPS